MPVCSLLRVFLAILWLWPATALAQIEQWRSHMDAATTAYQQGNYPEAEKQLVAALKEGIPLAIGLHEGCRLSEEACGPQPQDG